METNYPYNIYLITMTYDVPQGGTIRMAAESPEKATELLKKQFASYKNLEIAQIVSESDIKPTAFTKNEQAAPILEIAPDDDDTPPSQRLH